MAAKSAAKGGKGKATEDKPAYVSPIARETHQIYVVGLPGSHYTQNQFNVKSRVQMLFDHIGFKLDKVAKDPWYDGILSGYAIDEDNHMALAGEWWGMPTSQFKKGCIGACPRINGVPKTAVCAGVHFVGEFVRIEGPAPEIREDPVTVGGWQNPTTDLRYRLSWPAWYAKLDVMIVSSIINVESVVNLLNYAGTCCGAGENRPEKGGSWGMYQVATLDQIQKVYKYKAAQARPPEQIAKLEKAFDVWKTKLMNAVKLFISKATGMSDEEKALKLEYAATLITNPYQFSNQAA